MFIADVFALPACLALAVWLVTPAIHSRLPPWIWAVPAIIGLPVLRLSGFYRSVVRFMGLELTTAALKGVSLVSLVPVLGGLVVFLATVAGFGAALTLLNEWRMARHVASAPAGPSGPAAPSSGPGAPQGPPPPRPPAGWAPQWQGPPPQWQGPPPQWQGPPPQWQGPPPQWQGPPPGWSSRPPAAGGWQVPYGGPSVWPPAPPSPQPPAGQQAQPSASPQPEPPASPSPQPRPPADDAPTGEG